MAQCLESHSYKIQKQDGRSDSPRNEVQRRRGGQIVLSARGKTDLERGNVARDVWIPFHEGQNDYEWFLWRCYHGNDMVVYVATETEYKPHPPLQP